MRQACLLDTRAKNESSNDLTASSSGRIAKCKGDYSLMAASPADALFQYEIQIDLYLTRSLTRSVRA